jgi:hypothetical protein
MDQIGEVDYVPGEPKVTPPGSHRGFETVTYMIDGVFRHQDSNGGGGLITDGDTQWMTAGAGLSLALITLLTSTASFAFLSLPCAVPSKSNLGRQCTRGAFVRGRAGPATTLLCRARCLCVATCQQTASNKASQHHTLHRVTSKSSAR